MPGKHNAGGCGCCGTSCDICTGTAPIGTSFPSGGSTTNCSTHPFGTFLTASAPTDYYLSNTYSYDIATQTLALNLVGGVPTDVPCAWTWIANVNQTRVHSYGYNGIYTPNYCQASGSPTANNNIMSSCQLQQFPASVGDWYMMALVAESNSNPSTKAGVKVHMQFYTSPTRIAVVVQRYYLIGMLTPISVLSDSTSCYSGTPFGETLGHGYTVDEYLAEVDCGSLPESISWTARRSYWEQFGSSSSGTDDTIDLTDSPYSGVNSTWTMPTYIASASLVY